MIAWAGLERYALGKRDPLDVSPRARWPLASLDGERPSVARMAIALRNVAMPVRRSEKRRRWDWKKGVMENSFKNRPGMGSYAALRYKEP